MRRIERILSDIRLAHSARKQLAKEVLETELKKSLVYSMYWI